MSEISTVCGIDSPARGGILKDYNEHSQYHFKYLNDHSIKFEVHSLGGVARIPVYNGTDTIMSNISNDITASLTSSGVAGLDTGTEQANTGYYLYLVSKENGTDPELVYTISSSATPTMPSGYTRYSKRLWYVANNTGSANDEILPFFCTCDGWCHYIGCMDSVSVFKESVLESRSAIDLNTATTTNKALVPPDATSVKLKFCIKNDNSSVGSFKLYWTETCVHGFYYVTNVGKGGQGDTILTHFTSDFPLHAGLSGSVWWEWFDSPGAPQLSCHMLGFLMHK